MHGFLIGLQVFFGTPHHHEEGNAWPWVDLVFNITLASTEAEPFVFPRREILSAVVRAGPESLSASSSRFHTLAEQYHFFNIFEMQQTSFVGNVVCLLGVVVLVYVLRAN
jgi:hypothetical protein